MRLLCVFIYACAGCVVCGEHGLCFVGTKTDAGNVSIFLSVGDDLVACFTGCPDHDVYVEVL